MKNFLLLLTFLSMLNCQSKDEIENQTIYSSDFRKENFSKNLIGKSKNEIIKNIGNPLKITQMQEFDAFVYTKDINNISFYEGFDFIDFKNKSLDTEYIFFSFSNGKVKTIKFNGQKKIDAEKIIGKSKNEIVEQFGNPTKRIFCNRKNTILSYSDRGNGDIDNKMPKYYVKNIVLNEGNIAVKIIDTINNDLNRSRFACEENNFC